MSYEVVMKSGELYHHGIQGQKWGVQNGPPYPLKETVHDKIVKKAKTEEGRIGAELGKTVGKVQTVIGIAANTPAAIALVSSLAAANPPAAIVTAGALVGASFVDYKLNTIADAWIGSKLGDLSAKTREKHPESYVTPKEGSHLDKELKRRSEVYSKKG